MAHRIHSHTADRVQAQVKPGEALGFVGEMRDQGVWPPPAGRHRLHPGPTVTPFVVLRTSGADDGTRPISLEEAAHSESINIVDSDSGDAVTNPVPGQTYRLR